MADLVAVIARDGVHQLLFRGGRRRPVGADRAVVDRVVADEFGATVPWDQPVQVGDGRIAWKVVAA